MMTLETAREYADWGWPDYSWPPIVRCRHCGEMWGYSWEEILPYLQDQELKNRLEKYR